MLIDASAIIESLKEIKLGKSAGIDGLAAEHFVYSHSSISVHLALLFTCMLNHGHVPTAFMKTSIIPILKNINGDSSDKNNYRPIAIVTAMSKLFELCLSKLLDTFLVTSDNQFGFKRKHGTDLCIYTVKSVIKYYNYFSSPVYTCFLDASKAFDRVNPDKIFQLQKRAVRAISGANSKSHTEPLFKFYNILKVDDVFTYKLLTFYWKAKQAQLPKYLSKFLPELSEGANKYAIRHPRLQLPVHKHEYIKGTCRYQLAMLLNEISLSDNSLGQLKIVTTNVQIITLFGLKRIVKSCLVQNYSYYCAIPNCYVCQLYVN